MQEKQIKKRGETLRLIRRFSPFMTGSALKYTGCILAVLITVATSFTTPLLVSGAVDAITDTVQGNTDAAVISRAFFPAYLKPRAA